MEFKNDVRSGTCPGCGQPNHCAFSLGMPADQCWCMQPISTQEPSSGNETPILLPVPEVSVSCYCEACLEKAKKVDHWHPERSVAKD